VLDKLAQQDIGSFVVRDSTTHAGCYALSIRVDKHDFTDQGISHYLITRTPRGNVKLKVQRHSESIIIGYNNTNDIVYGAVVVAQPLRRFAHFICDWLGGVMVGPQYIRRHVLFSAYCVCGGGYQRFPIALKPLYTPSPLRLLHILVA